MVNGNVNVNGSGVRGEDTGNGNLMALTPLPEPQSQLQLPSQSPSSSRVESLKDVEMERYRPSLRVWLVFLTLAVLSLMVAVDGTSISVALPIIASKLNGSAIEAFWSGTSFLLTSTVFQPAYASFSNIFGRKPMILIASTAFFVGTLVAGLANNFTQMLAGRSVQGVGGGGLVALSEIIVTDIVPMRERGKYFGILTSMWSLGSVTGPIIGGGFSQSVSWRWIFYINFPFIGIGTVFVIIFLKLNFIPSSLMSKLRAIDYIGSSLFIASITSFLIPVTWGGVMYPWDSWRTLLPLVLGACGLIATMFYETYIAINPMIPVTVFATRTAILGYIQTVLHGLVVWCCLYYMPLYFETAQEYTPIISGVALFPLTFTVAPSSIIVGILVTVTGHYRWAIWSGFAIATLGFGLLCLIDVSTSIQAWIFLLLPSGIGIGMLFPALAFTIQASALPGHMAIAVAMLGFFRTFGQTLGVALGGTIFQNRLYQNLLLYPELSSRAMELSSDAAGLVQVVLDMDEGSEKMHLKQAYVDSLRIVWAVCCVFVGVAGLLSLFTKSYDLKQGVDSDQTMIEEKKVGDGG